MLLEVEYQMMTFIKAHALSHYLFILKLVLLYNTALRGAKDHQKAHRTYCRREQDYVLYTKSKKILTQFHLTICCTQAT